MYELNRRAMTIPGEKLVEELECAIQRKQEVLEERDRKYGADRVKIHSYGENIYMPETFGFDMRDYYKDAELALDIELRNRIFWLDNSHDDGNSSLRFGTTASMYFDITLFGVKINYTRDGVPNMQPHPLSEKADLSLIEPFDFYKRGEMPLLLYQYEAFKRLGKERYGDKLHFSFPYFKRGPLDILISLRGYENFVDDVFENPEFVHEALDLIVERRYEFNKAAKKYLGEEFVKSSTRIDDDWINFPFITPDMFHEFVVPAYRKIADNEGTVRGFHTCGILEPIAKDLVELFPELNSLDISGWNDAAKLDAVLPEHMAFWVNFVNTFVLTGTRQQHIEKLESLKKIGQKRKLGLCAQALVRLHPTLDESYGIMNDFIDLAHEVLYS